MTLENKVKEKMKVLKLALLAASGGYALRMPSGGTGGGVACSGPNCGTARKKVVKKHAARQQETQEKVTAFSTVFGPSSAAGSHGHDTKKYLMGFAAVVVGYVVLSVSVAKYRKRGALTTNLTDVAAHYLTFGWAKAASQAQSPSF